jgi:hypothetical protein
VAAAFIPDAELERQATALLCRYEAQEGQIAGPPIPIDLIIEHVLDIDIDWAPLDDLAGEDRVLAAIELTPSRRRILMNENERAHFDLYFGTEEYSKAHEAAHGILHLPQEPGLQPSLIEEVPPVVLCRSDQRDRVEIQAERFAAYLLMPEPMIRAAHGGEPITGWGQVYRLRDKFRVSATAMRRRLESLNLVYVDARGGIHPSREAGTGQRSLLG